MELKERIIELEVEIECLMALYDMEKDENKKKEMMDLISCKQSFLYIFKDEYFKEQESANI